MTLKARYLHITSN